MNDRLAKALDRLKAESANAEAPQEIEPELLAEFDRVQRRKRLVSWMIAAAAVAASIAVVLFVSARDHRPDLKPPAPLPAVSEDVRDSEQPFVPIPYVVPLGAYERAEVVRMEVPVAALIAAGFPMDAHGPCG
jgi:hypothetical protein